MSYSSSTKSNCNPFGQSCVKKQGTDSIIKIEENRSKYEARNSSNKYYFVLRADGCIIPKNLSKACDFILLDCQSKSATLIELKGKNIGQAIKQINATIDFLSSNKYANNFKTINARIVLTSTPNVLPQRELNKLRKLLLSKNQGNFKHGNSPFTENF